MPEVHLEVSGHTTTFWQRGDQIIHRLGKFRRGSPPGGNGHRRVFYGACLWLPYSLLQVFVQAAHYGIAIAEGGQEGFLPLFQHLPGRPVGRIGRIIRGGYQQGKGSVPALNWRPGKGAS